MEEKGAGGTFSFKGGHRWTEQHPVFVVVVIVIVYFELREGDI